MNHTQNKHLYPMNGFFQKALDLRIVSLFRLGNPVNLLRCSAFLAGHESWQGLLFFWCLFQVAASFKKEGQQVESMLQVNDFF